MSVRDGDGGMIVAFCALQHLRVSVRHIRYSSDIASYRVVAQKQLDDHHPICRNVGSFGQAHDEQHERSPVFAAALGSRSCVAER